MEDRERGRGKRRAREKAQGGWGVWTFRGVDRG